MSPNFHVCVPAALDALPAQASHPSTADCDIYIHSAHGFYELNILIYIPYSQGCDQAFLTTQNSSYSL